MINNIKNQNGQVLLFVTVIMTIALSIGAAISTRTLSSLSRGSAIDTSNKLITTAESAVEEYLIKTVKELEDLTDQGQMTIILEDNINNINTQAEVSVEGYKYTNTIEEKMSFNLQTGNIKEINLKDYSDDIDICWSNPDTAISYSLYDDESVYEKNIMAVQNSNIIDNLKGNFLSISEGESCATINIKENTLGLRFNTLFNNSEVSVVPSNKDSFPLQGFKITSIGKLTDKGKLLASKPVIAYRSLNYLPLSFDNVLYTEYEFNN